MRLPPAALSYGRVSRGIPNRQGRSGVTLLELLCVIAILALLAGLLLGPVSRALGRARAMDWGQSALILLDDTVRQLRSHFQGKAEFPPITLETLEAGGFLDDRCLRFVKDRRVTFVGFASGDPDDKVILVVRVASGFLTEATTFTETKGTITRLPE